MGQNNKFIIYKPLNFVVVCYAIKLTDTNFTEGLILESLILVVRLFPRVFCNFTDNLHEILFVEPFKSGLRIYQVF